MSRSILTALLLMMGLGVASADSKVDWSQYIEKPGDKPLVVAKPAVAPAPAATPAKKAPKAKVAKAPAKAKAKPAARTKHR
jgi:hypothetical protein